MINFKVPFPPSKKRFNVPTKFVYQRYLFSRYVKAISCYPILVAFNNVADKANGSFGLINVWSSKQYLGVKKDMGIFQYMMFFKNVLFGSFFNTANKMTTTDPAAIDQTNDVPGSLDPTHMFGLRACPRIDILFKNEAFPKKQAQSYN